MVIRNYPVSSIFILPVILCFIVCFPRIVDAFDD